MRLILLFLLFFNVQPLAAACLKISPREFVQQSLAWRGRTLIAAASWCSSCKGKLIEAKSKPEDFVILVAFDRPKRLEQVLDAFKITSPCIAGEELVDELKIDSLPWHSKIN